MEEILEARLQLPDSFIIHIYGPVSYKCPEHLKNAFADCYKGELASEEVVETLRNYDVLLLPTFHKGEGYPGIIIEALAAGLPVITTPLRGIKEMIVEGESGFFVQPERSEDLIQKMRFFSEENYDIFSGKARNEFQKFDNEIAMDQIFNEIDRCKPEYKLL